MSGINSWLIRLENRVSRLRFFSRINKPEDSKKELKKCLSLLEQIYQHASYQGVSISSYSQRIHFIQDELTEIQETITKKENSFWRVVVRGIGNVLSVVGRILGLGSIGRFLGGGDDDPGLLD